MTFGAEHNPQAVPDEYVHYLVEAEGLGVRPPADRVTGLAEAMGEALSVRPSRIEVDDPSLKNGELMIGKFQMRGRRNATGRLSRRGRKGGSTWQPPRRLQAFRGIAPHSDPNDAGLGSGLLRFLTTCKYRQ